MKVNFLTRLNTWLFVIPVMLILVLYFAIGVWFYISGATYVLKDFHSAQLVTMLSDKKNAIELWVDVRKKALDEIARSNVVANGIQAIIKGQVAKDESVAPDEKDKKSDAVGAEARQRIAKFMEGFGQFREISILSPDGKIIWSTNGESVGREWADQDIPKKASSGKSDLIAGRIGPGANSEILLFTAPVMLEGQGLQTLIVAIPNAADLATSLKVEKGFYETGKVSIIDSAGNVVAAKDITDVGTVRYNIRPGSSEEVGYRDGLYYSAASLRSGQLRLIATLDAVEAAKPLKPLMTVYLAFAGLIVLVMLMQGFFIAPRLIEKPLAKLLKATQSVAEEDLRANLRKGFTGELKTLADGFSQMIVGLSRRRTIPGRDSYGAEGGRAKVQISDIMPTEIKAILDGIAAGLENAGADLSGQERDIASAATEIKSLAATIVDMNQLLSLRQDPARISNKEFRVCEMFTEVEDACRSLANGKEIELIVECPENISGLTVPVDSTLLRILSASLLRNSIRNTGVGTITLLPSRITEDGVDYLELSVSDNGRGLDEQVIEKIMKNDVFISSHLELCIARATVDLLGGRMAIESMPGNGTLVTVGIPLSGSSLGDAEPVKTG